MFRSNLLVSLLASSAVLIASSAGFAKDGAVKKAPSLYKISGGLQLGVSTDRNAGAAPVGEKSAGDSFEDEDDDEGDEDDEDSGDGMDFGGDDDVFDDLELDGQDLLDQLDESNDEDGDGDFCDDDEDLGEDPIDGVDAGVDGGDAGVDVPALATRKGSPGTVSDERLTTRAKFGVKRKINGWAEDWSAAAQVSTASFDTLHQNDNLLFGINTGPTFKVKSLNATIKPSVLFATLRKDGNHQFDSYGGGIASEFKLSKPWKLQLRYGYDIRNFADSKVDNVTAHGAAIGFKYDLAKNHSILFGTRHRFEDTARSERARSKDIHQLVVGYQKKWQSGWYVKPQAAYAFIERDAAAKTTLPVRQDDRTTFNIALGRDFGYGITVEAQYNTMNTDTNIINKDTSNDRFLLLSNWKF